REWAIEWSKFYYGLDLAHAFAETAEPRFLAAWERLARSWIRTVPVGADPSHVAGRRIQNWIYAWNMFAAAPGFPGLSPGTAACIAGSLAAQVRDLRGRLTPERNHRTLDLYALFIAARSPATGPTAASRPSRTRTAARTWASWGVREVCSAVPTSCGRRRQAAAARRPRNAARASRSAATSCSAAAGGPMARRSATSGFSSSTAGRSATARTA